MTGSFYRLTIKGFILLTLILTCIQVPLKAQTSQFTKPSWWFGAAAGVNYNFYRGTTQELNSDLTVPTAFHNGFGVGLFLAPIVEYHPADSRWGFMLQAGFDNRSGSYDQVITPCDCPADLDINLSYLTVEPSLRFAPFKSNFYLFGGPRLAFNLSKSFTYSQEVNPNYPEQDEFIDVKGEMSDMNKSLISMQIGAGYDISLTPEFKRMQFILSPFFSYQPYFGQFPRSIESWNITTFRVGAALKFGRGQVIPVPPEIVLVTVPEIVVVIDPIVKFSVNSPLNQTIEPQVREVFPLRNYIFFNAESSDIPDRYVLLTKDQANNFRENQLDTFLPKEVSGRSNRELIAYYHILNILGDRMGKNPGTSITLVGSSRKGEQDALLLAESVKRYLVDIFGITSSRIHTKGQNKPEIRSEQPGGILEINLLREEDRRVTILSDSPALLMEFTSGPDAPLKPVELFGIKEAPLDSYVSFNAAGGAEAFSSWSLEIMDGEGEMQYFGPFKQDSVSIPGKSILGTRPDAHFKIKMIGQTKSGKTVTEETFTHLVLWVPQKVDNVLKFSVIFKIDDSKTISLYEKFLTNVVTPQIPIGGRVNIHGYTDVIGGEAYNQRLSLDRANDVRDIIGKSLAKSGRNDVKFDVIGFGEEPNLSRFNNILPEERFYNRSVVIEITPAT